MLVADPYVDSVEVEAVGATAVAFADLLPRAEVLSLHARLTPETRHLIGRDEIARLPDGAVIVNAARGGLLDQDALCDALDSGKLRAAALDVYDPEPPPPGSRLFSTPNLVLAAPRGSQPGDGGAGGDHGGGRGGAISAARATSLRRQLRSHGQHEDSPVLIGLDAGTSVVKAVAFGNDGEALRVASRPLRTEVPAPVEPNRTWKR